ncbi:transcription termination factor 5, mitochondrial-like [Manduca sexta]|uniref:transcription termination factor 5, mitochondrial-like n=1 Tax=Manduca sexta TaxID=7130 RepID=UPI00188F3113|nr:transcription termination factor 5, mitochondrial-like [Manduca sexta]
MNMHHCRYLSILRHKPIQIAICKHYSSEEHLLKNFSKHVNITESEARYLSLKQPVIKKLDETKLQCLLSTIQDLGFSKQVLLNQPSLFGIVPFTLRYRYRVLQECGIATITPEHLCSYLPLVKQKTISQLKKSGDISVFINVENRLASYLTQWPTSVTTLISEDVNKLSLYNIRLKIIQRYLELELDLTKEEFNRGVETYPTIKHRPLEVLNEVLQILLSQIMMPKHKIKSNLYLLHSDPENIRDIILKLRTIGGIDVREVIRMRPKLAMKNCSTMIEIKNILYEYEINNEAQKRCFDIYTLAPSTVRERLERARNMPEFNTFYNHPRFLKMIHYNNTVLKRLNKLYDNNKKCMSLNILSGSSAHYEVFEKAPGDRLGKGKDLLFCVSQLLSTKYSMNEIRKVLKRHPFWINIPLVQVKFVCHNLLKEYSNEDIYENCPILLYPWNKIRDTLLILNGESTPKKFPISIEYCNLNQLKKSQKLSLALYILEKNHYFTGNGVWTEEKSKTSNNLFDGVQKEGNYASNV